jgi:DtxR family Mn-dependent transcriptional regulator
MEEGPEEYLEALYKLTRDGRSVRTTELAKYLGVSPASATQMLQKLAKRGCVEYKPYHGTRLTPEGENKGAKMTRKHRLLETFLVNVLNMGRDKAHAEACELEHHLSDEAEEALCRILKAPDICADDGRPIPPCDSPFSTCDECMKAEAASAKKRKVPIKPLTSMEKGEEAKISFVRAGRGPLRRLCDMGLTPQTPIKMVTAAPLKGPVEIEVRGSKLAIGWKIASKVFVEAEAESVD